jgi:hypothetical protein
MHPIDWVYILVVKVVINTKWMSMKIGNKKKQ